MVYKVFEKQNYQSVSGYSLSYVGTLRGAKTRASRNQSFVGTTLVIEDETGHPVSYKKPGEQWYDLELTNE